MRRRLIAFAVALVLVTAPTRAGGEKQADSIAEARIGVRHQFTSNGVARLSDSNYFNMSPCLMSV